MERSAFKTSREAKKRNDPETIPLMNLLYFIRFFTVSRYQPKYLSRRSPLKIS